MRSPLIAVTLATLLTISGCRQADVAGPDVHAPVVLRIRPEGAAFNIGEPLDLTAMYLDAEGAELGVAGSATWSSSDPTVATIDRAGHFVARCVGKTTIVAVAAVGDRVVSGHSMVVVGTTGPTCAAS